MQANWACNFNIIHLYTATYPKDLRLIKISILDLDLILWQL